MRTGEGVNAATMTTQTERRFDWNTVRCRLLWYYKGPPNTRSGTFETVNFIIWRLLRGTVKVEAEACQVEAGAGSWVVMAHNLGRRHQVFSADALIESLHLGIDTNPAEWTGPSAVVFRAGTDLVRASDAVGRHVMTRHATGLVPGGHIYMARSFEEHIEVQTTIWQFLQKLDPHLLQAGMVIREPDLRDARVIASMALIENWPVNLAWDRAQISRAASVSPSQLDRIWRETRGQTPFQYWNARRIRFACDRLENSACSIKEIAFDLGFAHLAQFSTWFHSRMNTSPREYRRAFTDHHAR